MKKLFAFLFAASLSLAAWADEQVIRVSYYRVDDSSLRTEGLGDRVAPGNDKVWDKSEGQKTNECEFVVYPQAGEEFVQWVRYLNDPQSNQDPGRAVTNFVNSGETKFTWTYSKEGQATAPNIYIVLDFETVKYTLTRNANGGGSGGSEANILYTNKFNLPSAEELSKKGYSFGGWTNEYITATKNRPLEDGELVSGSTFGISYANKSAIIYAKWDPNTYTVTLDANGGEVSPGTTNVTYDAEWPELPTPTRENYRFDGWYDVEGHVYNYGGDIVKITENIALYAHWTRIFTATFFDPIGEEERTVSVVSNNVPAIDWVPSPAGYRFTGWNPSLTNIKEDTKYTAQYTGNTYYIKLHKNYGDDAVTTLNFTYGTPKRIGNYTTKRTGYVFSKWRDSDGNEYEDNAEFTALTETADAIVNFYAQWAPISYNIAFDGNGGEGAMVTNEGVAYDAEISLPRCDYTRPGLDFLFWQLDGFDPIYDGATVSNLTATAEATVTLKAIWSTKYYVAFDSNGGTGSMETQIFEGEEAKELTPNEFSKTGYTFGYWATNANETLVFAYTNRQEVAKPSPLGGTNTLYAVWSNNTYRVHFDANGGMTGEIADMEGLVYDVATNLTANAFGRGDLWTFGGWSNSVDGVVYGDGAAVSNLTSVAGGTAILYAVWELSLTDLSKVMECDNLNWYNTSYNNSSWATNAVVGYSNNNSATNCILISGDGEPLWSDGLSATVYESGNLSFWWKIERYMPEEVPEGYEPEEWQELAESSMESRVRVWVATNGIETVLTNWTNSADADWQYCQIPISLDGVDSATINIRQAFAWTYYYDMPDDATCTIYVDNMKWEPSSGEAEEPTEADWPVLSGFTVTADGFSISIENYNDSFDYSVVTNSVLDLGVEWGEMKKLGTDGQIEVKKQPGRPQLFYRVKVTQKQQ